MEMEQGNQQVVSASTASSSQNSLTGGTSASSSQNSLKGSGDASSSKNSTTGSVGSKVVKRKRSVLTLERKLEIIAEVKKGKSVRLVAGQFDVPKSTVSDIWKGREKIESFVSASECPSLTKKRCIVRDPNYEKLDQACHVWFLQQRSKGAPISGPVLKEKALQLFAMLYPDLNVDSFKASSGWLHKFCLRHGIKSKALHGESLSADLSCIGDFQSELHSKIESEGYTLNQIFNADETGLW